MKQKRKSKAKTMTDKNDTGKTPMSTPRRTLGICRRTPKSAPLPSRSTVKEPDSPLNRANHLTASSTAQSELQSTKNETSYATPVIRKRKRASEPAPATVDVIRQPKIGKKLELSLGTSPERPRAPPAPIAPPQKESIADVQSEIKRIQAEIEALKMHEKRKRELNDSIGLWKSNALEALKDLQEKIEPRQSITAILDHFSIPHDMFDIISLDED